MCLLTEAHGALGAPDVGASLGFCGSGRHGAASVLVPTLDHGAMTPTKGFGVDLLEIAGGGPLWIEIRDFLR
jgi:hypothetical protein